MNSISGTELNGMNQEEIVSLLDGGNTQVTVFNKVAGTMCINPKPKPQKSRCKEFSLSDFKKENKKYLEKPVVVIGKKGSRGYNKGKAKHLFYYV